MRLLVANFDQQDIVTTAEVTEALLRLPAPHIRDLQVVRYDPWRSIANAMTLAEELPNSPRVSGSFYHRRDLSVIVLFRFNSREEFYQVLYHEVGHCVFLRALNQQQRDDWMYRIRRSESATVSAYAKRNSREDFAETYSAYANQSERLRYVPLKTAFMREVVFSA